MAGASNTLHESESVLSSQTRDVHRALVSIQEELEAVDWYRQRAEAAADEELRAILLHNMREEIEHASMLLEWLRRREPHVDLMFRTYLFTDKPVTVVEDEAEQASASAPARSAPVPPLTVGTMKGG